MKTIVEIESLVHRYPDHTTIEFGGLDFNIAPGEVVALLGSNGSGKSTLLNHLIGQLTPHTGSVKVFGVNPRKEIKKIRHLLGMVLQSPEEQLLGPTVWDDIAFALYNAKWPEEKIVERVESVMADLSIGHLHEKLPHYLSGGEQQKVALAGAIVMNPQLLILDEPFSRLDIKSKSALIEMLRKINQKYGTAILLTSHDLSMLPELAHKVYIIKKGRFIGQGKPEETLLNIPLLLEADLEPPALLELVALLRKQGVDLPYSSKAEEVASALLPYLSYNRRIISR
ncbi:ABC transporter ATP-binding protein [Heliorestis acidaminivorans]|uniref:ABC transporter ATP-binding protein n=1 Tax=Heliorestis acidaminivorans TaxID=553427 RepID=A0A6I0F3Y1_9FIRM|nr:ABC transporter ATP-binding protein [Heliorestis acidaminivorans]KAB2954223.1 ABC transporter ATP-binding protein [Heliorestis acidaminivorans]